MQGKTNLHTQEENRKQTKRTHILHREVVYIIHTHIHTLRRRIAIFFAI